MRRWPLESFTELARRLLEDPEVFLLISGVASDTPDAQSMCARLGSSRALDLTGQTTMTELLHCSISRTCWSRTTRDRPISRR